MCWCSKPSLLLLYYYGRTVRSISNTAVSCAGSGFFLITIQQGLGCSLPERNCGVLYGGSHPVFVLELPLPTFVTLDLDK